MQGDLPRDAISTFFLAQAAFILVCFPLVATANTTLLDGQLNIGVVFLISAIIGLTPAFEFAFSDRDPYLLGQYIIVFAGLVFISILMNAIFHVAIGREEPIPAVTFVLVLLSYAIAYLLVYRLNFDYFARLLRA